MEGCLLLLTVPARCSAVWWRRLSWSHKKCGRGRGENRECICGRTPARPGAQAPAHPRSACRHAGRRKIPLGSPRLAFWTVCHENRAAGCLWRKGQSIEWGDQKENVCVHEVWDCRYSHGWCDSPHSQPCLRAFDVLCSCSPSLWHSWVSSAAADHLLWVI